MSGASADERVQSLAAEVRGLRENVSGLREDLSRIMDHYGISANMTAPGQQRNMQTTPLQTSKQAGPATASGNLAGQQPQQTCVTAADDALTRKKACATARPTNEQPSGLAADASPAPLGSLPPEL